MQRLPLLLFGFPWTVNQREHLLAHGLELTAMVPYGRPPHGHAGEQAIMRGPTAPPPPEALHDLARGTITRQPIHMQRGMGCSHVLHQCPTVPRGRIDGDDDLGILTGRICPSNISPVRRTGHVPTRLLPLAGLRFAPRGLLQQTGCQPAPHQIECRKQ
jgi:hypothetical protein